MCIIFHFLLISRYDIGNIQIVFSCFHCCIECDILKPFYCYFYHLVATLVLKSKKFGKNSTLLFHYWRARSKEHYTFYKGGLICLGLYFWTEGLYVDVMHRLRVFESLIYIYNGRLTSVESKQILLHLVDHIFQG